MPPCPYTPDFLDDQRRRLLAAGDRLRVQLAGAPTLALGHQASWSAAGDPAAVGAWARAGLPFALPAAALGADLAASATQALARVEAALDRLAAGAYGWDEDAAAWIPADRLRSLPSAAATLPPFPMESL